MGQPAARVGDMHVCPMVTGVVPHVGGPILPAGNPTVMIGKMPAVCVGDMCTCVGPPDVIVKGSAGVFIGGRPAARIGDMTAHGGSIILGCPTVFIGDAGGGSGGGGNSKLSKSGASEAKDSKNGEALKKAAKNGAETADKTQKEDFKAQFTINDEAGKPMKDVKYEITTSDGQKHDGKTDGSGKTQNLSGYTTGDCKTTFFTKN